MNHIDILKNAYVVCIMDEVLSAIDTDIQHYKSQNMKQAEIAAGKIKKILEDKKKEAENG